MKLSTGRRLLNQVFQLFTTITFISIFLGCGGGGGGSTPPNNDSTPNNFNLTAQTDVLPATMITSNEVIIGGINVAVNIRVSGGEYSINDGNFTSSAGRVSNGQRIRVRVTSSSEFSTSTQAVLTVANLQKNFQVTTIPVQVPNDFNFVEQTNVLLSTEVISNEVTISGIVLPVDISIIDGEYSIDGGSFTNVAGTISDGQKVRVKTVSASQYSTTNEMTLSVSSLQKVFQLTTIPVQVPAAFPMTAKTDAFLSTVTESNEITISDILIPVDISVTGGEYSIDGGSFTNTAGMVSNNQKVKVRVTSSASINTAVQATLTIAGVSENFTVTTRTVDAGGLFEGTGTVNSGTVLNDVKGIIRHERLMLFSVAENVLYDAQIQSYSGSNFTATVSVYKDGVNSLQADANGTITSQSSVSLTLSGTGYGSGSISVNYNNLYERGATFERFSAVPLNVWGGVTNTVNAGTPMGLRGPVDDNTFTGGPVNPQSCSYKNGVKNIPDSSVNLYTLSFNVTNSLISTTCDHIGENYTGFATIIDGGTRGTDGVMWFIGSNGTHSNFSVLEYQ